MAQCHTVNYRARMAVLYSTLACQNGSVSYSNIQYISVPEWLSIIQYIIVPQWLSIFQYIIVPQWLNIIQYIIMPEWLSIYHTVHYRARMAQCHTVHYRVMNGSVSYSTLLYQYHRVHCCTSIIEYISVPDPVLYSIIQYISVPEWLSILQYIRMPA